MTENKFLEYANEDTVQCFFFSTSYNTDVMFWEKLCDQLNKLIDTLSIDYIWHRDEFKVYLPIENKKNEDLPPHLLSTTCFGDNLEDEWFIVYLVLELSKQYEDIIIQIKDNDGDFLLIEAADYLPSWANPDCTDNRVFIYKSHIHIIPPTLADIHQELSLEQGIEFVTQSTEQTKAPEIQQAVMKRIGYYPNKIKENIHRAFVKIPLDLAALLAMKPSLISSIVTSYCNHDEIDAKSCRNVSLENSVTVGVKFTKFLYAMLVHSKLIKNCKTMMLHKDNNKKEILGIKLTCGYEMIKSKLSEDVFSSKEYEKFIKILNESGYFRGYLVGSQSHTQLLEKAKEFFLGMECPINSSVANKMSQIMNTKEFTDIKETLKDKSTTELVFEEDSEEWLNIQPEQLNDLLNKRYGQQSNIKDNDIISPQTITSELSNFLKQTSDFEGIETGEKSDTEDDEIEFDSNEFVNSLKNMLNLISDNNEMDMDNDFSDDYEDDISQENNELDEELKAKLNFDENEGLPCSKQVLPNIVQSMKEEAGATGPSSNILRTIGINKTDLLDSDDDY